MDFTEDERLELCEWIEYSVGWSRNEVSAEFTVEREMPGSLRLTFDRFLLDPDGRIRVVDDDAAREPFSIFVSDTLGWLSRYLARTGRLIA